MAASIRTRNITFIHQFKPTCEEIASGGGAVARETKCQTGGHRGLARNGFYDGMWPLAFTWSPQQHTPVSSTKLWHREREGAEEKEATLAFTGIIFDKNTSVVVEFWRVGGRGVKPTCATGPSARRRGAASTLTAATRNSVESTALRKCMAGVFMVPCSICF
jgi:hypothetical protein